MSIKSLSTAKLFDCIEKDLDMLDSGSWEPDSDSIEDTRTILLEIKARMLGGETEGGPSIETADQSQSQDSESGQALRRYEVGVTRVVFSREKTIPVLAMNEEDASARALELAHDMDFSSIDAEYECSVSGRDADTVKSGDRITWCDPSGGEEQDVIYRESHGDIVLCHTLGGGEVEVFPRELH